MTKYLIGALFCLCGCTSIPTAEDQTQQSPMPPGVTDESCVAYKGHDTVIVQRMNGDSEELLIITPKNEFVVGPIWSDGPVDCSLHPVEGGELLVAPFGYGTGTDYSARDALVVLFRDGQEPAVAQVWHGGYSKHLLPTPDSEETSHYTYYVANTIGYQVAGNTLITRFEYGNDSEPDSHVHTDSIDLIPGTLIRHRCRAMMDHVYGGD